MRKTKNEIICFLSKGKLNEIKNNFQSQLINKYEVIKSILNQDIDNKMKFLYFNKENIHQILYDEEETIELNNNRVKNNISNYFYLLLLIDDNHTLINYEYSIDFINNINKQLINENKQLINENKQLINENECLKNIILSKTVFELINNYKQLDCYDKEEEEKLDKLRDDNLDNINKNLNKLNDFEINLDIIKTEKIDKLYSVIIRILINKIKANNYEYLKNMLIELDLENISITKTIFEEISKIFNQKKEYKMFSSKNFKFTEEIINFYYILFKYILKDPIYIYNIDFLFESKKNVLNYIKNNSIQHLIDSFEDNNTLEKFKYIFEFITDSNNYNIDLILRRNSSDKENNSFKKSLLNKLDSTNINTNNTPSKANVSLEQNIQNQIDNKNNNKDKNKDKNSSLNTNNEDYLITNFEKIIAKEEERDDKINNNSYITFIKKISDDDILAGNKEGILYIYDKNFNLKKEIISKEDICDINLEKDKILKERQEEKINKKEIMKIEFKEINIGINNKNDKIIENWNIGLLFSIIEITEKKFKKIEKMKEKSLSKKSFINANYIYYFEHFNNNLRKKEIFVAFEKGLFRIEDISKINKEINIEILDEYKIKNKDISFKNGIKIDDNYIVLTSNSILSKGEDKLFIYDIKKNSFIKEKEIDGSFISEMNGLNLMDIKVKENQNKKILLCACKKYFTEQKNGIMVIDAEIKENEDLKYKFYDTESFEVNCFCQININKENKMIKTNFFFVGGLDVEKSEGIIKLYKINYNNSFFSIKYLDDIQIDHKNFEYFSGSVNCIIQNNIGKLMISCLNGNLYSFSAPNITSYLE